MLNLFAAFLFDKEKIIRLCNGCAISVCYEQLATDHHVHEETIAAITSLVEQPVVIIEQPPSRILRDLDFIDHPSDMFDDLSVSTNNMLNTCAREIV